MQKRDDFLRMMKDCEKGRIDMIITKSVTRFARNTVNSIQAIRRLKELGIAVFFEKENINSLAEKSEQMLTILSSLAQGEAESISSNNKWGILKRFQDSTYIISTPAYGYTKNENGELIIQVVEAVVVRRIFRDYLNGKGTHIIAKELSEEGVPTELIDMRLSAMAETFREQLRNPEYQELSFEDRFSMLVDIEWSRRQNNALARLIKSAQLRNNQASIEDIEYHPDRKLDKSQILRLTTGQYIEEHHNIILKSASGNGKTYLACALGIAACRQFYKVKYVRLPDLLDELAVARGEGIFQKVMKPYQKVNLLILDECFSHR